MDDLKGKCTANYVPGGEMSDDNPIHEFIKQWHEFIDTSEGLIDNLYPDEEKIKTITKEEYLKYHICDENLKRYTGLNDSYQYCVICDKKQGNSND